MVIIKKFVEKARKKLILLIMSNRMAISVTENFYFALFDQLGDHICNEANVIIYPIVSYKIGETFM